MEEFAYAEVAVERPVIDFGPHTRPLLGDGWSHAEEAPDGMTFHWALGRRSDMNVFLAWAREVEMRARCRSYAVDDSGRHDVTVLWDGEAAGTMVLGRSFAEQRVRLPGSRATPGWHRLTFVPELSAAPASQSALGEPSRDRRDLSFACDWIRFGSEEAPEPPRGEGDTLWIPASTAVSFYLAADQSSAIVWRGLSLRSGTRLEVAWEVEGAAPVEVAVTREGASRVDLPVPHGPARGVAPEARDELPARLTLRVAPGAGEKGQAGAGAALRGPVFALSPAGDTAASEHASVAAPNAEDELAAAGSDASEGPPPSILLWIVDTLRADRLGLYGFGRPVSPNYDRLAERSTVFEAAVAQSAWTRPTVATMLTGVEPTRHGVTGIDDGLGEEWRLLPEYLRDLGYATAGFSANGHVQRDTGFDQGFDEFRYLPGATVGALSRRVLDWLDRLRAESPDQPYFVMVLTIEPHAGYEPAPVFRERFAADAGSEIGTEAHMEMLKDVRGPVAAAVVEQLFDLYEAEIAWNDHVFGWFHEELETRRLQPLIVMIADHGEAFGERGLFGHRDLHREVLHIPFFIHLPGQQEGRRLRWPVQQADVLPTLLDLADGKPGSRVSGRSLAPLLGEDGLEDSDPAAFEALGLRPLVSLWAPPRGTTYSLVRGRWKLIEEQRRELPSRVRLFDLLSDPEERVDLAGERPLLTGRLLRVLAEEVESAKRDAVDSTEVTLDERSRRQLEAMGYID